MKETALRLRAKHLSGDVISGKRCSTLEERTNLLEDCLIHKLPILSMGLAVDKAPVSLKDKNWRGRAIEVFLGAKNSSKADRDCDDGEIKSTRIIKRNDKWVIEQTLRITTLKHADGSHQNAFEETPFYKKVSCFTCVLYNSTKFDINDGRILGYFTFNIEDESLFYNDIITDFKFYLQKISETNRISSKVKSPTGFLGCRQTAGVAGAISRTSLYITPNKFNELLNFYKITIDLS